MKGFCFGVVVVGCFAFAPVSATPISSVILDNYYGSNDHGYGDVIGSDFFDISKMVVTFNSGIMGVKIYTNFMEGDTRSLGIKYGDLFISSNGWRPYGSAANHYLGDNYRNGEDWEFVFDTSENKLYGGNFSSLLSDNVMSDRYIFRNGQEVARGAGGTLIDDQHPVKFGTETINDKTLNTILYEVNLSQIGAHPGDEFGFKWGMYCANDTIEGVLTVPGRVPEPGTLALLAAGFLGIGLLRKSKCRPNSPDGVSF